MTTAPIRRWLVGLLRRRQRGVIVREYGFTWSPGRGTRTFDSWGSE